jgi:hypothetical protein
MNLHPKFYEHGEAGLVKGRTSTTQQQPAKVQEHGTSENMKPLPETSKVNGLLVGFPREKSLPEAEYLRKNKVENTALSSGGLGPKDTDLLLGTGAIEGDGSDSAAVATQRKFYGNLRKYSDDDGDDDDENHGIGHRRQETPLDFLPESIDSTCAGGGCIVQ